MTDELMIITYRVFGGYNAGMAVVCGLSNRLFMLGVFSVMSGGLFALAMVDHERMTRDRKRDDIG